MVRSAAHCPRKLCDEFIYNIKMEYEILALMLCSLKCCSLSTHAPPPPLKWRYRQERDEKSPSGKQSFPCSSRLAHGEFIVNMVALDGPESSSALFDPYTFAHIVGAGLQFLFIPPAWLKYDFTLWQLFVLNFSLHVVFEVIENSPLIIGLFRTIGDNYERRQCTQRDGRLNCLLFWIHYGGNTV